MNRPIFDNFCHRSPDHIPVYIISRRMDRVYNDVRHINEVKLRRARGVYWDWRLPLVGLPSRYLSGPLRPTQPGHPTVDRCNEYRRWFRPSLGRNGASEVTTLRRFLNQLINNISIRHPCTSFVSCLRLHYIFDELKMPNFVCKIIAYCLKTCTRYRLLKTINAAQIHTLQMSDVIKHY